MEPVLLLDGASRLGSSADDGSALLYFGSLGAIVGVYGMRLAYRRTEAYRQTFIHAAISTEIMVLAQI
jgi:hypothetical protein